MPRSSISRLLRRGPALPPAVTGALAALERLVEERPELREAAAIQSALLRAAYDHPPQAGEFDLAQERASEKLRAGVPLLRDEPLPLDRSTLRATFVRLCKALYDVPDVGERARAIATAVNQDALELQTLAGATLGGAVDDARGLAVERGLDADLLCTLLRFSLFPALEPLAARIAPLRAATSWRQGYCPTCGGWPLLGEYRGLDQTRFLRCGLCASEWAADRLFCPFCGSRNHLHLNYLHVEEDDQRRAVTCDACRGYIKMLVTLAPLAPLDLMVQDLATLHLDVVALERGYTPPV